MTTTPPPTTSTAATAASPTTCRHGPLVVAVPGMGDLRSTYRHLVPALVDAGFRVATMDLRGHGDSDATFTAYDDAAAASDILALVEHLGGPAIVVGNSMGAGAAVIAAAQNPALVTRPGAGRAVRPQRPQRPAWQRLLFRAAMGGPWARLVWLAYCPNFFPGRRGRRLHRAPGSHRRGRCARPGRRGRSRATTRISHAPAEAVLDRVRRRRAGGDGHHGPRLPRPAAEAEFIAATPRRTRSLMIPDAGHYPQAEFPELTTPAVVGVRPEVTARTPDA